MRSKSLKMKNGFTVIELILSFAFVSAIAASLFAAVVNYRDKEEEATVEARLISFKNRMILEIQKDIETKLLNKVEYCRDGYDNIINRCVIFKFLDGSEKTLMTAFEQQQDDYGNDSFEYLVPYLLYGDLKIEYDTRKDTKILFISFYNYHQESEYISPLGFNFILGNTIMPIQVNYDSTFSWLHTEA